MKSFFKKSFYAGLLQIIILIGASLIATPLYSQKVKKGWNFGPLPAVSYNSDLGFQYGLLCDIYWFGDGSTYPEYLHKFNIEVSRYTKGSGVYHFFYDSRYLFPGLRVTADVSYLTDTMMDFYGFNGYLSPYNSSSSDAFYKFNRNLFRSTVDVQGSLGGHFSWVAGIGFYGYKAASVKLEQYQDDPNLYDMYVATGLIGDNEKDGGSVAEFKLGAVYDTRDNEADPYKGFKGELLTLYSLSGKEIDSYGKVFASASGFIPIWGERLTFAAKGSLQATIYGEQPFFMLQNISTLYYKQITNEGLGGLNTVRGVLRNRIVGAGIAWANIELRYRFAYFPFLGQNWYLVLNPFFDAGRVIQYHKKELMESLATNPLYSGDNEALHMSAGLGFKAVMNRNFIISAEWGKPFDKRDGTNGLSIGLNFIF
ncbi:MAG: hypothetical protein WCR61_03830 [Bacteroidales bacterium]|nr:hypothetical protein [Bacteroidales bacterium]MDD4655998.1 hypothetical protein [Bacteroidales bacterium]